MVAIRCKGVMKTLRQIITFYPEHSRWICVCRFEKFGRDSRLLEDNFSNDEELRLRLREKAPKVGEQ